MTDDHAARRIIYDFGANNGDDIPYYLMKADLVVAVDANPAMCALMTDRFSDEVRSGRLIIEQCVLTDCATEGEVHFYNHRLSDRWGQFSPPSADRLHEYDRVLLPSRNVAALVRDHGVPHYIKIDVEGYDGPLLRSLFEHGIRPPFISAESHTIDVFCLLAGMGGYNSFKLVEGDRVDTYGTGTILTPAGVREHWFHAESAGPFGDDIRGEWACAEDFFQILAIHGLGWKDIHATTVIEAAPRGGKSLRAVLRPWITARRMERLRRRLDRWRAVLGAGSSRR
ncbi:FkbM family methyltransferase [Hoeflea marina]|uniref:FkbM family methyltransferase n=1 Tax=Hoeflea marina TaxID=274592 RepID=A0A317PQ60_9HYPH|nr:FkbM family methyltransferase [Hoeflea marina]PWW03628.1 FkbM family methyltransferase [Hoeflea marina]